MRIDKVLSQLRVTEGIIREKLELSRQDWSNATRKYSILKLLQSEQSEGVAVDQDGFDGAGRKFGREYDAKRKQVNFMESLGNDDDQIEKEDEEEEKEVAEDRNE